MSCKKCGGTKPGDPAADLKRYAYLTPRQLRYLQQLEGDGKKEESSFIKDKKE